MSMTADEWMVDIHETVHGSPVAAQNPVADQGQKGVLAAGEVRVAPRPGSADIGHVARADKLLVYERFHEAVDDDGDAALYIANCFGYSIRWLAVNAKNVWPGAPDTDYKVRSAIERGRSHWSIVLRRGGFRVQERT